MGLRLDFNAAFSLPAANKSVPAAAPGPLPDGLVLESYHLMKPGIEAILTGQADSVVFTEAMAASVKAIVDEANATSGGFIGLGLTNEPEEFDYDSLVGKTFAEVAEVIGIDATSVKLPVIARNLQSPAYTMTTIKLDGFTYELWKTNTLESDGWVKVPNFTQEDGPDGTIILTDPAIAGPKAFYRVQATPPAN